MQMHIVVIVFLCSYVCVCVHMSRRHQGRNQQQSDWKGRFSG